jgi:hypothetical protein
VANVFKVTDLVAKESLRIAHERLQFIGTVDRQYDESFVMKGRGSPHGSTLRVKNPNQYTRRTGNAMAVQAQDESTQTITVATLDGVDMGFNHQELIQSVDNDGAFDDLSRNYIQPAISMMCSGIESDFIAFCTKATAATAGTAGTAVTDLVAVGAARAKLNQQAAPKDGNRCIQADSVTMGGLVNGLKGLFQDSAQIKEQYREGMMGRTAMADWYENDRMWTLPNTADVSGGTLDTYTIINGDSDLTVTGITTTPVVGMTFTLAGIFDCHPETKAAYPHLKQFTIVSPASQTAFIVSPTIYITGAKKNVCGATGADIVPANLTTAALVFVGLASTNYVQSLMYHKEAYQFITAPLPILDDAQKCVVVKKDNLSLRCWMGSDIRNNELLMRIDILYGMAALRQEWGCRIIGAAS